MDLYSGVDIVEISRIKNAVLRWGKKFIDRVYTPGEYEYSFCKTQPYPHLAARFSAKEAVIKALGSFNLKEIRLTDIEILNSSNGKPDVILHNHVNDYCSQNGINVEISISHARMFAVSNAIAFKNGKNSF